jgi:hypothetical protein
LTAKGRESPRIVKAGALLSGSILRRSYAAFQKTGTSSAIPVAGLDPAIHVFSPGRAM